MKCLRLILHQIKVFIHLVTPPNNQGVEHRTKQAQLLLFYLSVNLKSLVFLLVEGILNDTKSAFMLFLI